MMHWFREGGFMMWPILGAALLLIAATVDEARTLRGTAARGAAGNLDVVLVWGGLAAVLGVLGTLVGIAQAAGVLEGLGSVQPSLLWGGLRVALITSIFGLLVFVLALVLWFGLRAARGRSAG